MMKQYLFLGIFTILSFEVIISKVQAADSVIDHPSSRVLNTPIKLETDENGKIIIKPNNPKPRPPKVVALCEIDSILQIEVIKNIKRLSSRIRQVRDGQVTEKTFPYVFTQKLTKDMLGQYAAAVVIAQELGITELDYIKLFLVDPQRNTEDNKVLIFFYDRDDDIIDRTLLIGNQWIRCTNE
jgi:hypothetical protein